MISSSPDTGIAARSYQQVSVLTEQHSPDAANMALHHCHDFCFWRHIEQMHRTVLGARGHERSTPVVHHPTRIPSVKHDQITSVRHIVCF